jgi:hypothetical protein
MAHEEKGVDDDIEEDRKIRRKRGITRGTT